MSDAVKLCLEKGIATITLNRPQVLNALTLEMLYELEAMMADLNQNKACKVIIITGTGRGFVAGADIKSMKNASAEEAMHHSRLCKRVYGAIEAARPVTIAAVNGYALGGGLELALACDIRVAAESARLGIPETAIGSIPGSGGTQRLPRLVGMGRAIEMLATAEKVPAQKALTIGLVEHVVPDEKLLSFSTELAASICKNSTNAIAEGKRLMHRGAEMDMDKAMDLETAQIGLNYGSHDQREGMLAFTEKRAPVFE